MGGASKGRQPVVLLFWDIFLKKCITITILGFLAIVWGVLKQILATLHSLFGECRMGVMKILPFSFWRKPLGAIYHFMQVLVHYWFRSHHQGDVPK